MQTLINTVWRGFGNLTQAMGNYLVTMYDRSVQWIEFIATWLVQFWANLLALVVEVIIGMATEVVSWLPEVPTLPELGSSSFLDAANAYVPVSETMVFVGIWTTIFAGVMIVKLIRLVSPVSS